jgi:hypothetical protein
MDNSVVKDTYTVKDTWVSRYNKDGHLTSK